MTPLVRPMKRSELDTLVDWAAACGWNPGLADAEIFWGTDPDGFLALERDGELIGGGAGVSYGGRYGFMGFFIVHPALRGQGLGGSLWHERVRRLERRLAAGSTIGMDGVFEMQPFYERGGFKLEARDIRFEGVGAVASSGPGPVAGVPPLDVQDARSVPMAALVDFDARYFPVRRPRFLEPWIQSSGGAALVVSDERGVRGYGVIRPCRVGHKIGPLFSDSPAVARSLFRALSATVPGAPVFLDVPEDNPAALALASEHGMREVCGCARLFRGPAPRIPMAGIFGVTTFELG